ncbi:hypothetical protein G0U57_008471, partial [Chelydra serpentina]
VTRAGNYPPPAPARIFQPAPRAEPAALKPAPGSARLRLQGPAGATCEAEPEPPGGLAQRPVPCGVTPAPERPSLAGRRCRRDPERQDPLVLQLWAEASGEMAKAPGCPSCYLPTALFFAALCGSGAVLRRKDCPFPDPSDHTTYRCAAPACKLSLGSGAFKAGSVAQRYCEPATPWPAAPGSLSARADSGAC